MRPAESPFRRREPLPLVPNDKRAQEQNNPTELQLRPVDPIPLRFGNKPGQRESTRREGREHHSITDCCFWFGANRERSGTRGTLSLRDLNGSGRLFQTDGGGLHYLLATGRR